MIIDFRVRPPTEAFTRLGIYPRPQDAASKPFGWHSPLPPSVRERSLPKLREEMAACGVTHAVLWGRAVTDKPQESTSAADVARLVREHGDLFVTGFAGVGVPEPGGIAPWLQVVDTALGELGLRGITVDAQFAHPPATSDEPRLYPIYQRCQELGGILALTVSRGSGPYQTLSMSHPEAVDRIAGDFPGLPIVVSHACWPWVQEGLGVAFRRENVYLCPDLYAIGMPGYLDWVQAANTYLTERIVFASAYPFIGVGAAVESWQRLPFRDDAVREQVLYRNAARLLGLPG